MVDVQLDVPHTFVDTLISMTEKVAGFPLNYCNRKIELKEVQHIQIYTKGVFRARIAFRMESSFRRAVLKGMQCSRECSQEMQDLYLGEFVNILSGCALTKINNKMGATSWLTVPQMGGISSAKTEEYANVCNAYFTSEYGNLELQMSYDVSFGQH